MTENRWILDWNRQKLKEIIPSKSKHVDFVIMHWMKHDTLILLIKDSYGKKCLEQIA